MSPLPRTALIGGTSLLESPLFQGAERHVEKTPHGPVTLMRQGELLFLQRHGVGVYTPPHLINHRANLQALQQAGVEQILAVGSVGSLRLEIPPGSLVVPDDFYAPHLCLSFFDDVRGHRAPAFDPPLRQRLLKVWQTSSLPPPVDHGVYWQTIGPRFETPAEIRAHQSIAHVVGMTVAAECILACELEISYAALCMVDNYANGLVAEPLSYDAFRQQVRANESRLLTTVETLLAGLRS